MLNVAAEYSLEILTADIKGAYLIPDIVEYVTRRTCMDREVSLCDVCGNVSES
jgi:hypothetical protein